MSPVFSAVLDEATILRLVTDVAETLERCAVDDTHTPALYASFLRALIDNKKTGVLPGSRAASRLGSPVPNGAGGAAVGGAGGAGTVPGVDVFLRSRAGSLGPIGEEGAEETGEGGPGGAGNGVNGHPLSDAFDPQAMDSLLAGGDFWSNMLMPGFGGPLAGLSGGSGTSEYHILVFEPCRDGRGADSGFGDCCVQCWGTWRTRGARRRCIRGRARRVGFTGAGGWEGSILAFEGGISRTG